MKLKSVLLIVVGCLFFNIVFSQTDGHDELIDSMRQRWHLTGNAYLSGYNANNTSSSSNNILLSVFIGNEYYQFPSPFLDSMMANNLYVTKTGSGIKNLIQKYKVTIPPPTSSAGDSLPYNIISKEEYLYRNAIQYKKDSIAYSFVEKHPRPINSKQLLFKYLKERIFEDKHSDITVTKYNIDILTFPNFNFLYPIDSISFPSKYIAIVKTKGKNQPHDTYVIDSYHNLFLAPGPYGYVVGMKHQAW